MKHEPTLPWRHPAIVSAVLHLTSLIAAFGLSLPILPRCHDPGGYGLLLAHVTPWQLAPSAAWLIIWVMLGATDNLRPRSRIACAIAAGHLLFAGLLAGAAMLMHASKPAIDCSIV